MITMSPPMAPPANIANQNENGLDSSDMRSHVTSHDFVSDNSVFGNCKGSWEHRLMLSLNEQKNAMESQYSTTPQDMNAYPYGTAFQQTPIIDTSSSLPNCIYSVGPSGSAEFKVLQKTCDNNTSPYYTSDISITSTPPFIMNHMASFIMKPQLSLSISTTAPQILPLVEPKTFEKGATTSIVHLSTKSESISNCSAPKDMLFDHSPDSVNALVVPCKKNLKKRGNDPTSVRRERLSEASARFRRKKKKEFEELTEKAHISSLRIKELEKRLEMYEKEFEGQEKMELQELSESKLRIKYLENQLEKYEKERELQESTASSSRIKDLEKKLEEYERKNCYLNYVVLVLLEEQMQLKRREGIERSIY